MSIFKLIQLGFLTIFGFRSGMQDTRKALEEFSQEMPRCASEDFDRLVASMDRPDKQRLREGWDRVSQDLGRAYRKAKEQLSLIEG